LFSGSQSGKSEGENGGWGLEKNSKGNDTRQRDRGKVLLERLKKKGNGNFCAKPSKRRGEEGPKGDRLGGEQVGGGGNKS